MKIAALTMVYRDYWALSRWYSHHGNELGYDNLFVVSHGVDPEIAEICPKASIITIPRDTLSAFDRARANVLNGIHAGLSNVFDWVIRTDADELICYDPEIYKDLATAIEENAASPVLTALGFDVFEMEGDPALKAQTTFSDRSHIAFSGHYSKAVASRRAIDFSLHGVRVAPRKLENFPFHMPKWLYLAHLKFANAEALRAATKVRMDVGNSDGEGLPGAGWRNADEDALKIQSVFLEKDELPWSEAETLAYQALSIKPARFSTQG